MAARKHAELDELLTAVQVARALLTHLADCRCATLDDCVTNPTGVQDGRHGQVGAGSGCTEIERPEAGAAWAAAERLRGVRSASV